jgi:predicted nucleic acid-binding Zn ribbon protein
MPEPLPPHTHCLTCDAPIPETESFCSDACKASYDKQIKKSRRTMLYFYITAIVLIVMIAVVSFILG